MSNEIIKEIEEKFTHIEELMEANLDEALLEIEKIKVETLPEELKYDYYYLAGDIHYQRDDFDDAIIYYNLALKNPTLEKKDAAKIYGNLAFVYCEKELYKESICYAKKTIQLSSDNSIVSRALNRLALSYTNLGKYDQSIHYLLRTIELFHEKREDDWSKYMVESAYASLSFSYWKVGDVEKSEYYFQKLTSLKNVALHELKRGYLCKAHRLYEKHQWKNSLEHYNRAISFMNNEEEKQHYQKYINDCKGWLARENS